MLYIVFLAGIDNAKVSRLQKKNMSGTAQGACPGVVDYDSSSPLGKNKTKQKQKTPNLQIKMGQKQITSQE